MRIQQDGSLPHAAEAELGLCSVVLNYTEEAMAEFVRIGFRIEDILNPVVFSVVSAKIEFCSRGTPCDIRVLFEHLKTKGTHLEFFQLSEWWTNMASVPMLASYCKLIQEKACLRDLLKISGDVIESVNLGELESTEITSQAAAKIEGVLKRVSPTQALDTRALLLQAAERYEKGEDTSSLIKTGFENIDNLTPIRYGDFLIIGGETKSGKTTFALNIIANYITQNEI